MPAHSPTLPLDLTPEEDKELTFARSLDAQRILDPQSVEATRLRLICKLDRRSAQGAAAGKPEKSARKPRGPSKPKAAKPADPVPAVDPAMQEALAESARTVTADYQPANGTHP